MVMGGRVGRSCDGFEWKVEISLFCPSRPLMSTRRKPPFEDSVHGEAFPALHQPLEIQHDYSQHDLDLVNIISSCALISRGTFSVDYEVTHLKFPLHYI